MIKTCALLAFLENWNFYREKLNDKLKLTEYSKLFYKLVFVHLFNELETEIRLEVSIRHKVEMIIAVVS